MKIFHVFFDTLGQNIFKLSSTFYHSNNDNENKEIAKIQTIIILSGFQFINIYYVLIDPLLIRYFCINTPLYIIIGGIVLLLLLNYRRYIYNGKLDILTKPLFFNNKVVTYLIIILYFIISIYLFIISGDYVRNIYLNNCR